MIFRGIPFAKISAVFLVIRSLLVVLIDDVMITKAHVALCFGYITSVSASNVEARRAYSRARYFS